MLEESPLEIMPMASSSPPGKRRATKPPESPFLRPQLRVIIFSTDEPGQIKLRCSDCPPVEVPPQPIPINDSAADAGCELIRIGVMSAKASAGAVITSQSFAMLPPDRTILTLTVCPKIETVGDFCRDSSPSMQCQADKRIALCSSLLIKKALQRSMKCRRTPVSIRCKLISKGSTKRRSWLVRCESSS